MTLYKVLWCLWCCSWHSGSHRMSSEKEALYLVLGQEILWTIVRHSVKCCKTHRGLLARLVNWVVGKKVVITRIFQSGQHWLPAYDRFRLLIKKWTIILWVTNRRVLLSVEVSMVLVKNVLCWSSAAAVIMQVNRAVGRVPTLAVAHAHSWCGWQLEGGLLLMWEGHGCSWSHSWSIIIEDVTTLVYDMIGDLP